MSDKLSGNIALITRDSSGINFASAGCLLEVSAFVYITCRRKKEEV